MHTKLEEFCGGMVMNKDEKTLVAQKIREQYAEKEESEKELDRLRKLDAEAKRPANIFAYAFGTVGSLVMGTGMCYAMEVLGEKKKLPGVILGVAGMLMMCSNYPMYKKILASRKEIYAGEIIELSEKIMNVE